MTPWFLAHHLVFGIDYRDDRSNVQMKIRSCILSPITRKRGQKCTYIHTVEWGYIAHRGVILHTLLTAFKVKLQRIQGLFAKCDTSRQ